MALAATALTSTLMFNFIPVKNLLYIEFNVVLNNQFFVYYLSIGKARIQFHKNFHKSSVFFMIFIQIITKFVKILRKNGNNHFHSNPRAI
jgi:hypothetical protein